MTHHWTVEDFCRELGHLEELAKLPGMSTTLCTMVDGFIQKIHGAKQWDSHGIVSLLTKLELSTLANDSKDKIKDSMTKIAQAVNGPEVPATNGITFEALSPYLTNKDWEQLKKCSHLSSMQVLATRLRAIGLASLKEDTKKQAIGIIIHVALEEKGQEQPNALGVRSMTQDFGIIFHSTPNVPTMQTTLKFPADPNQLGKDWLLAAYGQEEKPALVHISPAWTRKAVPTRRTKAEVAMCLNNSQSSSGKEQQTAADQERVLGKLDQLLHKYVPAMEQEQHVVKYSTKSNQGFAGCQAAQVAASRAMTLPMPATTNAAPLPLGDQAHATQEVDKPSANEAGQSQAKKDKDNKDLQMYEQEAYVALAKAKSAAKAKAKGKAKCKASPPVLKKPAAAKTTANKKADKASSGSKHGYYGIPPKGGPFGCIRCRGVPKGCSSCQEPTFGGLRFKSRSQWTAWKLARDGHLN